MNNDIQHDRTHNEIWERIEALKESSIITAARMEAVENNQEDFKDRIANIEKGQEETALSLAAHRAEFKTGTGLLAFLIITCISLLGIYSN